MAKLIPFAAALAALALAGCETGVKNLTSEQVPANPSGIYTLHMSAELQEADVVDDSLQPSIVIDGQRRPMQPSGLGPRVYEYDYKMPPGRSTARYYYELDYELERRGQNHDRQLRSNRIYDLRLINRYPVQLEAQRGPVGARIGVLGRGFNPADIIVVGGYEADTEYQSPNAMSFVVPPLEPNEVYPVDWRSGDAVIGVGTFRVDPANLTVNPTEITVQSGERAMLVVGTGSAAPSGGLRVQTLTDIPGSVILPEITIPEGERTVSVQMEGGEPGFGYLHLYVPGFEQMVIPVTVQ